MSLYTTNDTHTVFLQIGSPDLVILLACSNQQLRQRLEKRASQQGRPDDNTHAIEKRLDTFKHNITLIAKYYQERGLIVRVRCCSLLIFILTVEFSWFSQHVLWMITNAALFKKRSSFMLWNTILSHCAWSGWCWSRRRWHFHRHLYHCQGETVP